MSNTPNTRSYNVSPLVTKEEFLSFLEPSPRPNLSRFNGVSTRAQSPSILKKTLQISKISQTPSLKKMQNRLEISEKQNLMLQERNKVLSKEKSFLIKKIKNEASPCKIFKGQAIALTKESYLKRMEKKKSQRISELEEKIPGIRKILT